MRTSPKTAPRDPRKDPLGAAMAACRNGFVMAGVFSFLINLLLLTIPLYMIQIFSRVLAGHSKETLFFLTLIALAALLFMAILDMARGRILIRTSIWLERRLAPVIFGSSIEAALVGDTYRAQSLRDLTTMRSYIGGNGVFALFDAPWVPVYVLVIFLLHPVLGVIALCGAAGLLAFALVNEIATRKPLQKANAAAIAALQNAEAAARNAGVVDALGMMPGVLNRWSRDNGRVLSLQENTSTRAGMILSGSKFLRLALQVGVLGAGAYFVVENQLTAGAMIAGSIILARALAPVEQAIGTWRQFLAARDSYHRLADHLGRTQTRDDGMALPPPRGALSVEQVVYTPPGLTSPVLAGVNFSLEPGESLAVVGPSAAGKSTLARLMVGNWKPSRGAVRLDGSDVYTWPRADFGRYVGYLPQEIELFSGTIRDNIARLTNAPPPAVVDAARIAGVHQMILALPQGYDTEIGEGGLTLSTGQRQRIALARALFGRPRLVVLDEPESNLDRDGEMALAQAIEVLRRLGATLVIVAHRPNILRHVDKILLLRDGKVALFGPRDEVAPQLFPPREASQEQLADSGGGEKVSEAGNQALTVPPEGQRKGIPQETPEETPEDSPGEKRHETEPPGETDAVADASGGGKKRGRSGRK